MTDNFDLKKARNRLVAKDNRLIQNSRYALDTNENKAVLYLISKIQPEDEPGKLYSFNCKEFQALIRWSKDAPYKKIKAVRTTNLISGVAEGLSGVSKVATIVVIFVWVIALMIIAVSFVMMTNMRKKEFAVLRAIGASGRRLFGIVMEEGLMQNKATTLLNGIMLRSLWSL